MKRSVASYYRRICYKIISDWLVAKLYQARILPLCACVNRSCLIQFDVLNATVMDKRFARIVPQIADDLTKMKEEIYITKMKEDIYHKTVHWFLYTKVRSWNLVPLITDAYHQNHFQWSVRTKRCEKTAWIKSSTEQHVHCCLMKRWH